MIAPPDLATSSDLPVPAVANPAVSTHPSVPVPLTLSLICFFPMPHTPSVHSFPMLHTPSVHSFLMPHIPSAGPLCPHMPYLCLSVHTYQHLSTGTALPCSDVCSPIHPLLVSIFPPSFCSSPFSLCPPCCPLFRALCRGVWAAGGKFRSQALHPEVRGLWGGAGWG